MWNVLIVRRAAVTVIVGRHFGQQSWSTFDVRLSAPSKGRCSLDVVSKAMMSLCFADVSAVGTLYCLSGRPPVCPSVVVLLACIQPEYLPVALSAFHVALLHIWVYCAMNIICTQTARENSSLIINQARQNGRDNDLRLPVCMNARHIWQIDNLWKPWHKKFIFDTQGYIFRKYPLISCIKVMGSKSMSGQQKCQNPSCLSSTKI